MSERDKFLTEAMGECWHEWEGHWTDYKKCLNCKTYDKLRNARWKNNNFSTPDGFFKLWNWVNAQDWIEDFEYKIGQGERGWYYKTSINPDNYANEVYEYLNKEDICHRSYKIG